MTILSLRFFFQVLGAIQFQFIGASGLRVQVLGFRENGLGWRLG